MIKLQEELVFHIEQASVRQNYMLQKSENNCNERERDRRIHCIEYILTNDDKTRPKQNTTKNILKFCVYVPCKPIKCMALQLKCWYLRKFLNCKQMREECSNICSNNIPSKWHTLRIRARKLKRGTQIKIKERTEKKVTKRKRRKLKADYLCSLLLLLLLFNANALTQKCLIRRHCTYLGEKKIDREQKQQQHKLILRHISIRLEIRDHSHLQTERER